MTRGSRLMGACAGLLYACSVSVASASVCSSLNGPFCTGISSNFAAQPRHAAANLDRDEQLIREENLNKQLKTENVLKQYEVEAERHASLGDDERILEELSELLDETAALLSELEAEAENGESPVIGSFAFSSEGDTYDLLETMDGKELKEFFELAYDEVLRSWESTLEDMSPEISQGLRESVEQLKALKDYEAYTFRYLDESSLSNIRQRFENHRLIEVQRMFERLVVAKNPHERQAAFESVVYILQLAQEEADDEADLAALEAKEEEDARKKSGSHVSAGAEPPAHTEAARQL